MKVYLDDERVTPEGWIRTHTVQETISKLLTGEVSHLSLDNDLGSLDPNAEGYQVLNFLEETIYSDPTFPLPIITIHSANASRAPMMRKIVQKLEALKDTQT